MQQDEEHLKLLTIFHYVVGGLAALFACFPIIHLVVGIAMVITANKASAGEEMPIAIFGLIFVAMAVVFIVAGWALAVCIVLTGRYLAKRTRYNFCLVVAAVECIFMPFGTVLGIFTILVLTRDSVKALFNDAPPPEATAG